MGLLGQGLMRIIISAEVREAVAGLKAVSQATQETTAEVQKVAPATEEAAAGVTQLGSAATTAKTALAGLGTGLAIGLAIAAVTALGAALVEFITTSKRAEEGAKEFALAVLQIESAVSDLKDQLNFEKKFTDLFDKLAGKTDAQKLSDDLANNAKLIDKLSEQYKKLAADKIRDQQLNAQAKDFGKGQDEAFVELAKIHDDITKAKQEQVYLNTELATAQKKEKEDAKDTTDEGKKRLAVLQQIKSITDQIAKPDKEPLFKQEKAADPLGIDTRVLQAKITEAIKGGIADPANADAFNELANRLKDLLNKTLTPDLHVRINPDLAKDGSEKEVDKFFADTGKELDERLKRLPPLKPKIFIEPKLTVEQLAFKKQVEEIEAQLKSLISNSIEGLAEGLGNALSGGGFKSLIASFGQVIGEGLKSIGKILIEAAIATAAVKKAAETLASANPALGIVAGIAAIAAGTIIENEAKQAIGATKFATGGIITGPTLGLVGEAGPEVIFPLEKLNQFIKGANTSNNVNVGGELRVSGSNLVTVLNRQNKLNGLSS